MKTSIQLPKNQVLRQQALKNLSRQVTSAKSPTITERIASNLTLTVILHLVKCLMILPLLVLVSIVTLLARLLRFLTREIRLLSGAMTVEISKVRVELWICQRRLLRHWHREARELSRRKLKLYIREMIKNKNE